MRGKYAEKKKQKISAIVPGSFDPVTVGHMFLIDYAAKKYRKVYVVIFVNPEKQCRFSVEERLEMLRAATAKYKNVVVDYDAGMQYLYAQRMGITVSVRGYRNEKDLEYEQSMSEFNSEALPGYTTELLRCPENLTGISSTFARELIAEGGDFSAVIPVEAAKRIENMR